MSLWRAERSISIPSGDGLQLDAMLPLGVALVCEGAHRTTVSPLTQRPERATDAIPRALKDICLPASK